MKQRNDKIEGDLVVDEQLRMCGLVTGNVHVTARGVLEFNGTCGGALVVEEGGKATVGGTVGAGAINQGGELTVNGVVAGVVRTLSGKTHIAPDARVGGHELGS